MCMNGFSHNLITKSCIQNTCIAKHIKLWRQVSREPLRRLCFVESPVFYGHNRFYFTTLTLHNIQCIHRFIYAHLLFTMLLFYNNPVCDYNITHCTLALRYVLCLCNWCSEGTLNVLNLFNNYSFTSKYFWTTNCIGL